METADPEKTFFYFGFGSNLLAKRIHANNPSAVRRGTGKIENYRLDFGFFSSRWNGAVATIVPDENEEVWGAVWEIDTEDIPNLDRQEGVQNGVYRVVFVNAETLDGKKFRCRCYQLCQVPSKNPENEPVPEKRKPSLAYLNVVLEGAQESNLPTAYVDKLRKVQHNGWNDAVIQQIMLIEEAAGVPEKVLGRN